jgi:hypothetical protein
MRKNDSKPLGRSKIICNMPTTDEVTFALYQSGVLSEAQLIQLWFPVGASASNVDPGMQDRVLIEACYKSHERLIAALLEPSFFQDHTGDRASVVTTVEQIAIARDLLGVIRFYVDNRPAQESLHHIAVWACQRPSLADDIKYQHLFDDVLLTALDPSWVGRFLGKAAKCGNLYAVERLLDSAHIDPSACENHALCQASRYGHIEVVRRLLRDPRIDPARFGHRALGVARSFDQAVIAKLLVDSSRITFQCISVQDSMDMAVDAHNTRLVVALLADGRASLSNAQLIKLLGHHPTQSLTEEEVLLLSRMFGS